MKNIDPHRVRVLEEHERPVEGTKSCRLGQDLKFDKRHIEQLSLSRVGEIDIDLLATVGAVAFADRSIPRKSSAGQRRNFVVSIPVHVVDVWRSHERELAVLLGMLTGDRWIIEFRARERPDDLLCQKFLPLLSTDYRGCPILPYSGGLDSFCGLCEHMQTRANEPIILVHAGSGGHRARKELLSREQSRYAVVEVPFVLSVGKHPEPSYRSRTFVFFSMAALSCQRANGSKIIISEAGQGCLGPAMVPFGDEAPVLGCHPKFVKSLERLLSKIWGQQSVFDFPNIWQTKGGVLRRLKAKDALVGWQATRSCSRYPRRHHADVDGKISQCGVCSGCVFRRMSLVFANLHDERESESYLYDVVSAQQEPAGVTKADREVLIHAALGLDCLANAARSKTTMVSYGRELSLALALDEGVAETSLSAMLERHASEWSAFLAALPSEGWFRQIVDGASGARS